jgi:putative MATE family efflux protein
MEEYTERLGDAPLGRLLLKLSVPGIVSAVSVGLYNIVDTFWVARLGHEAIAALTIVYPYQILVDAVGISTGIGITSLVSRRFGEKDLEATNHIAGQIFSLGILLGLIFTMAALFFSEEILTAFGATPDIIEYGNQYLVITSYGAPMLVFAIAASQLIRGSGDAVKPMIIMVSASTINIILDPLMILGIGPFPEMGIRGAALATVISQSLGAAISLIFLQAHRTAFRLKLKNLIPDLSILRDIYRVGAPTMILQVTESLTFVLHNVIVSGFGSLSIAALGLAMRIIDLAFMPIVGVSNGLLPIIGYNFGARLFRRLWKAARLASAAIIVLLAVATIFIELLAVQIIGIFTSDPEYIRITIPAMRIMLSGLTFIGAMMMFITVFQGLGRGTMALVLSLIRQFIIFVPLLFLFRHLFGLYGVWWVLPTTDVLSFAVTFFVIYREYLKHKKAGYFSEVNAVAG